MLTSLVVLCLAAGGPEPDNKELTAPPVVEPLVDPAGVKGLRATFLVDAPPEVVLQTLWDVKRFRSIFPDIERLEVKAESPELRHASGSVPATIDVQFWASAVVTKITYTLRRTLVRDDDGGAGGRITWVSLGGDVKSIRGGWRVMASGTPGVTRVEYESYVDIGTFVPTSVVRDIALQKVNVMAERVRAACRPLIARP